MHRQCRSVQITQRVDEIKDGHKVWKVVLPHRPIPGKTVSHKGTRSACGKRRQLASRFICCPKTLASAMLERHVRTRRWGRQAFSPGGAADTAEIADGASFSANFATRLGSVNARGSSGSGSSANVWCVIRSKLAFWSCAKPRHERRDLGPVSVCEFVRRQLPRRPTRVDSRGLGPVRRIPFISQLRQFHPHLVRYTLHRAR